MESTNKNVSSAGSYTSGCISILKYLNLKDLIEFK
jgi:hypothetical protein